MLWRKVADTSMADGWDYTDEEEAPGTGGVVAAGPRSVMILTGC